MPRPMCPVSAHAVQSAEGGGPGAASGGPKADVNVRLACLEFEMKHLKDGQKELKDDVRKGMVGDTPFLKELKDDMRELKDGTRAVLRWCQLTAGFAACASLFAVYPCATC